MHPNRTDNFNEALEHELEHIGTRDHAICNHYRIFGPPGTGKTYYLIKQIRRAFEKYGTSILVTSHTRTAAYELVSRLYAGEALDGEQARQVAVLRSHVRTLHSHCYRAIVGQEGRVFLAANYVTDWNLLYPHLALTGETEERSLARLDDGLEVNLAEALSENATRRDRPDPEAQYRDRTGLDAITLLPQHRGGRAAGDRLLAELNRLRGLMRTQGEADLRSQVLREFEARWTEYKQGHHPRLLDYTDLIELALEGVLIAPGDPRVILVDEAQDFNRMQSLLIHRWGRRAEYFVECGDDDQCIFAWTGAAPDTLLHPPLPEGHHIVLRQSRRLPEMVYRVAEDWIHQVPASRRQPKEYSPRGAQGALHQIPEYLIETVIRQEVERSPENTVMILASCHYMLAQAMKVLRERLFLPFHNPYRPQAFQWNPLQNTPYSLRNQVIGLMAAFERPWWTAAELASFTHQFAISPSKHPMAGEAKTLHYGARTELERLAEFQPDQRILIGCPELDEYFEPGTVSRLAHSLEADAAAAERAHSTGSKTFHPGHWLLKWWWESMKPPSKGPFSPWIPFLIQVAERWGVDALKRKPQVILGTIHSVKGGEADAVILYPNLSPEANKAYRRPESEEPDDAALGRDAVIRTFYVGLTRARERLYLVEGDFTTSAALWASFKSVLETS